MVTLLHGDNLIASYTKLQSLKNDFDGEIVTLEAKSLTPKLLQETIGQTALFHASKLVVIEGLPKANVIGVINQVGDQAEIIIWLDRKTAASSLKAKTLEFKDSSSQTSFKLADSLTSRDLKGALRELKRLLEDKTPPELIIGILARQLRLIIQVLDKETSSLNPYVAGKIKENLNSWTKTELKRGLEQLLKVDHQIKTGRMEASHALFNYLTDLL
jgi:hypothetical protein